MSLNLFDGILLTIYTGQVKMVPATFIVKNSDKKTWAEDFYLLFTPP